MGVLVTSRNMIGYIAMLYFRLAQSPINPSWRHSKPVSHSNY